MYWPNLHLTETCSGQKRILGQQRVLTPKGGLKPLPYKQGIWSNN